MVTHLYFALACSTSHRIATGAIAVCLLVTSLDASPSQSMSRTITATAEIRSATSLRVSSETMTFVVTADGRATASIDFVAATRLRRDEAVVLTMEIVDGAESLGRDAALSFTIEGSATGSGPLSRSGQTVIGAWRGSGRREGSVQVSLAGAAGGTHVTSVRFILTAP